MNIDNLIVKWANYERNRLEQGSGFPKQTVIASWAESQSHGGFGGRLPTGIEFKNLTDDVIKIRKAVEYLESKYKNVILYKFVGQFPMRVIQEELNVSQRTVYNYIDKSKKLISLHFSNY